MNKTEPVVGIFLHHRKNPFTSNTPFGGQYQLIVDTVHHSSLVGYRVVIFSYKDIDWNKKIIRSHLYNHRKKPHWFLSNTNFPDAIYDRSFSLDEYDQKIFKLLHSRMNKRKIPFVNARELIMLTCNKWKFYKLLKQSKKINQYLPETLLYRNLQTANKFINKHKQVILKPIYGGMGRGIIDISKKGEKYIFKYRKGDREKVTFYKKSGELDLLTNIIKMVWRDNKYILQPKIKSLKYNNRVFDLRVIVQKSDGYWKVPVILTRIAKPGSFMANLKAGGNVILFKDNIGKIALSSKIKEGLLDDMKAISKYTARYIDQKIGQCGELGIDYMIDEKGKLWLIEINSKIGKSLPKINGIDKLKKEIRLNPIKYARYLAKK